MSASQSGAALAPSLCHYLLFALFCVTARGAFINFDNCLETSIIDSDPKRLQFVPLFFDARFNTSSSSHNLNVTVYGNVTGQQYEGPYPSPDNPQWQEPSQPFGKIVNVSENYSTLFSDFKVVTFDAYDAPASQFCKSVINGECPLGPAFYKNASDPSDLPAFTVAHNFESPYYFATFQSTLRIVSGDKSAANLACVSANITPDLGASITGLLTWLPAVVLIFKGIATVTAAIWSPWGSSDIFRWSSNHGRDEDLLRLVTPGFGDCLQYIQFVTLTGALSLQYPGFYQPAVSQTSWSILLFNQSFVSHGPGTQSLVDGIYVYNGTYGMAAMSQLIGMTQTKDIWACMAIYLLGIAAAVVILTQIGFFGRWIYRLATNTSEEDLRSKNLPFTLGNLVRLVFNFFILPIVALSLFQLVITDLSPTIVVVMAAITLGCMLIAGAWIFRVIFKAKPRTFLFDDMPTVLLYGPMYNTYSDSAAPFALVPVFITFMRGVALGSIQPSGIAQIIVLAICEVVLILTLNGFRPFQGQTSMNAYHTAFAVVRLITVLLAIAFAPSLGVTEAPKGWIGYVILLLHALVLVFGFFLNSAQTLLEVLARALGAGGDAQHGAIRGSILNMRMLKKRRNRPVLEQRQSMASNAAMLRHSEGDLNNGLRSRSMSASSNQLLSRTGASLSGFENFSSTGERPPTSPGTELDSAGFGYLPVAAYEGKTSVGARPDGEAFYRAPRPRKPTLDPLALATKPRANADFPYQDSPDPGHLRHSSAEVGFAPHFFRDRADSNEVGQRPDYAVREVDQYYRGPALSDQPTRKLKTGPADPEGPAANAQSWLQRLMAGMTSNKKKEPSKGFEVVRSSRMPLEMQTDGEGVELQSTPPRVHEPYHDSPSLEDAALAGARLHVEKDAVPGSSGEAHPLSSDTREKEADDRGSDGDADEVEPTHMEDGPTSLGAPPFLAPIDTVGGIELPSRFNSRRSQFREHIDPATAQPGQNWLADVDNLSWNVGNTPPQPFAGSSLIETSESETEGTPRVPRRSSKRISRVPIGDYRDVFAGFDSNSGRARRSSGRQPSGSNEAIRYVSQHRRAADSITRNSLGANVAMQGSSAEIIEQASSVGERGAGTSSHTDSR